MLDEGLKFTRMSFVHVNLIEFFVIWSKIYMYYIFYNAWMHTKKKHIFLIVSKIIYTKMENYS